MYEEAKTLASLTGRDPFEITTISRDALLVTPYHRVANRLRETAREYDRHGSTGQGVGETRAYSLKHPPMAPTIGTMKTPYVMNRLLEALRDVYTAEFGELGIAESPRELTEQYFEMTKYMNIVPSEYIDALLDQGDCVFEGAQGVLLDENFGFHPHTTWTDTTARNARKLLGDREHRVIGLTRSYHTRHGAGPFPTENWGTVFLRLPELHNGTGTYQGHWRKGALDLSLLEYAVKCNDGVDDIMVSHMDYASQGILAMYGYRVMSSIRALRDGESNPFASATFNPIEQPKVPTDREEQELLGKFLSSHGTRPAEYGTLFNEKDVATAVEFATGVRPTMFAYGPTAEDRRIVQHAAV
jgi:adenylosuccinate synthase